VQITKEEIDELLEKLEEIRLHRGKTKAKFAEKFDVSPTSYSNWVNKRKDPSDLNAYQIKRFVDQNYGLVVSDRVEEKFKNSEEVELVQLGYPLKSETLKALQQLKSENDPEVIDSEVSEKIRKAIQDYVKSKEEEVKA